MRGKSSIPAAVRTASVKRLALSGLDTRKCCAGLVERRLTFLRLAGVAKKFLGLDAEVDVDDA